MSTYPVFVPESSFFAALAALDRAIALEARASPCPACGGPLDFSTWRRKPRGGPDLPDDDLVRWGLCCRRCRKRVLPPSALFFGRHVYSKPVVLLVVAARQRQLALASLERLRDMFAVSRQTIVRWIRVFLERLPSSDSWIRLRGRVAAGVRDQDVPASLLDLLLRQAEEGETLRRLCEWVPGL